MSCFGVLWAADGQCPFNGVTDDALPMHSFLLPEGGPEPTQYSLHSTLAGLKQAATRYGQGGLS